jgi:hypothetical protein
LTLIDAGSELSASISPQWTLSACANPTVRRSLTRQLGTTWRASESNFERRVIGGSAKDKGRNVIERSAKDRDRRAAVTTTDPIAIGSDVHRIAP